GAIAPNNNSCSRYVAQILVNAMEKNDPRCNKIFFPECLKASPTSNVVNAVEDNEIYCYHNGVLEKKKMGRFESLKFQVDLLTPNFLKSRSHEVPDELLLGFIEEPKRPKDLPNKAEWLGGLGEGCWYSISANLNEAEISKFNHKGEIEYSVIGTTDAAYSDLHDFKFSYHVHHKKHLVKQNDKEMVFKTLDINNLNLKQSI